MGWRFDRDDEGEPVEIEIERAESGAQSRAVATAPKVARSVGFVALGVVVGVLVTLTVTRRDPKAGPATTASTTTTTTTTTRPAPTSTASQVIATSPSTAPLPPVAPVLPFGHETGIVLYLAPDGGAPDGFVAYDVDRAQDHAIQLGGDIGWYIRALDGVGGVVVDGGAVVSVVHGQVTVLDAGAQTDYSDAPFGRLAPGPQGGLWLRRFDPAEIELLDVAGHSSGVHLDLPLGADLYGSTADGLPVVRGADGRVFVVGLDGQRTQLGDNALGPVDAGRFAETRCDTQQHCQLIGHIDGREVDLGSPRADDGTVRRVRFQPGGSLVAIDDGTRLSLVDTASGQHIPTSVTDLDPGLFGDGDPPLRFLPDGLGLVASTQRGLDFLDLGGKTLATISRGFSPIPGPALLGVGKATPWQSP